MMCCPPSLGEKTIGAEASPPRKHNPPTSLTVGMERSWRSQADTTRHRWFLWPGANHFPSLSLISSFKAWTIPSCLERHSINHSFIKDDILSACGRITQWTGTSRKNRAGSSGKSSEYLLPAALLSVGGIYFLTLLILGLVMWLALAKRMCREVTGASFPPFPTSLEQLFQALKTTDRMGQCPSTWTQNEKTTGTTHSLAQDSLLSPSWPQSTGDKGMLIVSTEFLEIWWFFSPDFLFRLTTIIVYINRHRVVLQ